LDFLGFSRPNRDFSMGYAAFSQAAFFARRVPRDCPPRHDGGPRSRHTELRGCSWVKSLPLFLLFRNNLSALIAIPVDWAHRPPWGCVMAGHSPSIDGRPAGRPMSRPSTSRRHIRVPIAFIFNLSVCCLDSSMFSWMAGTSPAMTAGPFNGYYKSPFVARPICRPAMSCPAPATPNGSRAAAVSSLSFPLASGNPANRQRLLDAALQAASSLGALY